MAPSRFKFLRKISRSRAGYRDEQDKGMILDSFFNAEFDQHLEVARASKAVLGEAFKRLTEVSTSALKAGHKLVFFGNGGSAADAQHLATELTVRYITNRPAIAAIALTTDSSALTAIGNDLGFEHLFSRQIEALGRAGDVAIAITTSGKSPNILKALAMARQIGMVPAALTGKGGGDLHGLADPMLIVPSDVTARIQEMHITIGHAICELLEERLTAA